MSTTEQTKVMALLEKLAAVIDTEADNRIAAVAACTLLVHLSDRMPAGQQDYLADMIRDIEAEVRNELISKAASAIH